MKNERIKAGLSLDKQLYTKIKAKAKAKRMKISNYLDMLMEKDLNFNKQND